MRKGKPSVRAQLEGVATVTTRGPEKLDHLSKPAGEKERDIADAIDRILGTSPTSSDSYLVAQELDRLRAQPSTREVALEKENAQLRWMLKDVRDFLKRSGYDTRLVDAALASDGREGRVSHYCLDCSRRWFGDDPKCDNKNCPFQVKPMTARKEDGHEPE